MLGFKRPRRLANKIVLLVLALELVSISVWGSMTYLGSREELLRTISSQLSEAAFRTDSAIGNFFVPIRTESRVLADMVASPLVSDAQKRILVHRLLNRRPEVEAVSLVGADGRERWRVSRTRTFGPADVRELKDDAVFRAALSGRESSGPITLSKYFEPQVRIATPVVRDGKTQAVVICRVSLKWLWDTVQSLPIGQSGYVYLVDRHLDLVAARDPSLVLSGVHLPDTSVPRAMFAGRGRHELLVYPNFKGDEVAGVSRFDPAHRWWVVVEQPVKEGLAPLRRVVRRFSIAFLLAATATVLIVLLFSRLMMRPLETLETGIARLAGGERRVRLPVPRHSELATIAEAFNDMAESLEQKIEGLESSGQRLRASEDALRDSTRHVRLLLESTAEGIFGIDESGRCVFCNPAGVRLLGYEDSDALTGRSMYELLQPAAADGTPIHFDHCPISHPARLTGEAHLGELMLTRANGSPFFAECWVRPVDTGEAPAGAVLTMLDVTERHRHTAELEYQASHDALTHLPNRNYLHGYLEQLISENAPRVPDLALLLVDLDRFKEVNDALGHHSGDRLLTLLGPRLLSLLEGQDVLARLGGDEFAILLHSVSEREAVEVIAARVRAAIQQPFDLEGMRVQIDASIGIALSPEHATDASELLRLADVAMYQAKQAGVGCAVYDRELDAHSPRRLALMSDLGHAIADNQLVLHYQPQISLSDGRVTAVEALVRWEHPVYGLLGPDQFIPLAELGEIIKPLTLWVIRRALRDWQGWYAANLDIDVGVNISARNLHDRELPERIGQLLQEHCPRADCLQLEITESAIMTDPSRALETINAISALGVSLAIDDFGTGYSSLSYLKRLNVDALKIDRSFVMELGGDENDEVIVRSTVELAHSLGLSVTAEGVESERALQLLAELRCDHGQGFHICPPMPAEELTAWFAERSVAPNKSRRRRD
ncbi:MAG: EAL domain-containing protein [Gammaproteobacteria bacterium]